MVLEPYDSYMTVQIKKQGIHNGALQIAIHAVSL